MQSRTRRRSVMDQETRIRLVESEKQLQFDFSDIYARACSDRDIRGMKMEQAAFRPNAPSREVL